MRLLTRAGVTATVTTLALASGAFTALPAQAAPRTLVVDDDGLASASNCNATVSAYSTIAAAVAAAHAGDTIKVCPGTYVGANVNKALILKGAKSGLDARTRSTSNESIIDNGGSGDGLLLSASGITVDGFYLTNNLVGINLAVTTSGHTIQNNIVTGNTIGLYLNGNGAKPTLITHNLFSDNNLAGPANGNGIYGDQGVRNAKVIQNSFLRNANSGILLTADQGRGVVTPINRDLLISNNTGANNATFITLWNSQNVMVQANTHTDTDVSDDANQGSAYFAGAYNNGVTFQANSSTNSPWNGFAIRDSDGFGAVQSGTNRNVTLYANKVTNPTNNGLDITAEGLKQVTATNSQVTSAGDDGLHLGDTTNGVTMRSNRATGSVNFDCADEGTANVWQANKGNTSSPAGICTPPAP